jgi:hypothetical protein
VLRCGHRGGLEGSERGKNGGKKAQLATEGPAV